MQRFRSLKTLKTLQKFSSVPASASETAGRIAASAGQVPFVSQIEDATAACEASRRACNIIAEAHNQRERISTCRPPRSFGGSTIGAGGGRTRKHSEPVAGPPVGFP